MMKSGEDWESKQKTVSMEGVEWQLFDLNGAGICISQ